MTSDVAGQDRVTRRAVRRAVWTGHAPNASIDALARDAADVTVRNVWQPIFYAIILIIELTVFGWRLMADPPVPLDSFLAWTALAVSNAIVLAGLVTLQRRSRRYLRL